MAHHTYQFGYSSAFDETHEGFFPAQTTCNKVIIVDDGAPWTVPMREFANFMSGVYGYNITEKLLIEEFDGSQSSLNNYGV